MLSLCSGSAKAARSVAKGSRSQGNTRKNRLLNDVTVAKIKTGRKQGLVAPLRALAGALGMTPDDLTKQGQAKATFEPKRLYLPCAVMGGIAVKKNRSLCNQAEGATRIA